MSLTIQELDIIKENISYAFNYIEVEICCSRKQTEENEKKRVAALSAIDELIELKKSQLVKDK